jgi:hypothetical protein
MKYLDDRSSKLHTVFTFEIIASRSSKLDFMFVKLFFYTYRSTVLGVYLGFNLVVLKVLAYITCYFSTTILWCT